MTDTPESAAEDDAPTVAPAAESDPRSARQRRSVWARLNRTNRIAALVLSGMAAVVIAGLIFGAGLLIGAEYGNSEDHHDGVGSSEHGDSDHASGEHAGDDGESADEAGPRDSDNRDGGDRESGSEAPESQAPGPSNNAPRP